MMSGTLIVKIITPSKVVLESEATMVNIPGSKGQLGVLPGHVNFVSTLNIGIITLFSNGIETKYFVYGGLAQVTGEAVNIITEFSCNIESVSITEIRSDIIKLQNDLSKIDIESIEAGVISTNIEKHQALLKFVEAK